ncbi:hypothetical protein TVAG_171690 [Trichomonas vaginalis G3]|uniref:Uncharacterized protein n=1 Tax=Trichomonas vaginalis (strain ATCC PRA-98 / G3) TaxID=412133 RepID=A2EW94_TRIV3|nr:hypothetical protein TVAGG3_0916280 [Trichomonas vaginalis G3]EAY03071.1 hypothetical protein TVAG_171690 [Trichomonas vaginalis G3]KAI5484820.1 hypothetical protein TVAGG3_0916280 [Trichomonas vaginalis G3]|eukprot:XP_001315294.1 hypothetical protein [Trichomonas vaginalis G3]
MRPSTIELINELEPSDNWLFFDSNNSEYIKFILELISVKQFREILQPKAIKGYFQRSFAELLFKYNYLSQTDVKTCGNAWIQFLLDVYEGESLYSMNENQNKISKLLIRNAMENFLHICKNLVLFGPYTCILYIWNEKICQNSEEEKSKLNYFPISIPFIPENHLAVDPNNLDPIVDLFEQGYKDILIYAYLSEFHTIFVNFLDEFPTVDDFHKDYTEIIPKIKTRLISHDYSDQALSNFIDFFVRYFPDNELGISPQVEEDVSNKTGIDIKFFKKMNPNYNLEEEELEEKRNKDEFVEMFSDARFPLNEYYRQNVGYTFKTNLNFKVDDEPPDFG